MLFKDKLEFKIYFHPLFAAKQFLIIQFTDNILASSQRRKPSQRINRLNICFSIFALKYVKLFVTNEKS